MVPTLLKRLFFLPFNCVGDQGSVEHKYPDRSLKRSWISYHFIYVNISICISKERTWTTDWFQIGKGGHQGCVFSPCLFNLYAEYIMRNPGWIKHKLESRLLGEISVTSDMQMTPPLWQKVKRNSKAS